MKQEWKLRNSACLSFGEQWRAGDTPVQYIWANFRVPWPNWETEARVDMEKKCSFSAAIKSSYFKAMPRKDENNSRIQRSRTVASSVPWSSWALPLHCVVIPVLHSCPCIACVVTMSVGKTNPEENTCQQEKVLLKDLTAQDVGFYSPDQPVV